ncbi:hypothetical protein [Acinetobacter sp. ANC 4648]|uniref:hypothetical protein n=1 Tax=Acinetobacter sp. ANC 4648 TaxID=1977875 RepID=UPI001BB4624D|nr:hypothetical protein [Acinetobacter sp. ANC 4648]
MIFIIGWSGVSVASTKSMHLVMQIQHEQMKQVHLENLNRDLSSGNSLSTEHEMSNMSAAQMSSHCQQMIIPNKIVSADLSSMALNATCISVSDAGQIQHQQCPDCSLMACQAMIVWLNATTVELTQPLLVYQNQFLRHDYQAQHLTGHWQEILRPPKNLA